MEDAVSQKIFKLNAGTHQRSVKSAIYGNMNVWAMLPFSAGPLKNHPRIMKKLPIPKKLFSNDKRLEIVTLINNLQRPFDLST